jgi:multidrug efflux pump subunit AcrA (membrane-fusion protein)
MKGILGVVIALAIGGAYADGEAQQQAAASPPDMQVITVKSEQGGNDLTIGGTVMAGKQVAMSAELPGRVVYIAGNVGDNFESGTTLVKLDETELTAREEEAYYQVNIARAALENAKVQYERAIVSPDYNPMMGNWSKMFNRFNMDSFMSKGDRGMERYSNVYDYRTRVSQARESLRQAESRLRQVQSKMRDSRTIAPFDGVLVKKNIEVGDTVMPGQPLLEFADLGWLQMTVDVPTRVISGLREGMRLPARLDHRMIQVEVYRIYPVADVYKHTVKVELDLPYNVNASPGMYAEVMVPDQRRSNQPEYPMIPKSSVVWRGTLPAIYKLNDSGEPELRLVRIGEARGNNVQVLSGIVVGDQIVGNPKAAKGWGTGDSDQLGDKD